MIVYDITDTDSFARMSTWVKELRQQRGQDLPIIIVGNKCDREKDRVISQGEAEKFSRDLGLEHFKASARTGHNVLELFRSLTERK